MTIFSCCCPSDTSEEQEPLPVKSVKTRQPRQNTEVFNKEGILTTKLVNVQTIDTQFSNIADTVNQKHNDHSAMVKAAQKLNEICGCSLTASLTACIKTVQQQYDAYQVQARMKGYNFSLIIKEKEVPDHLKQVKQQVEELSRFTNRVLARKTTLQEMIRSLLQSETQLEESIETANPEFLDQLRLKSNLRENMKKIKLAKNLSERYDEAAGSMLREMAQLAGLVLEEDPEIGTE